MNLIAELENEFKNKGKKGTAEEQEKIALEFLSSLNFKDKDIQSQALEYVRHMLSDYVEKNEPVSPLETKMMYSMITKTSLAKLGLDDVKIEFRNRTDADRNAAAFYAHNNKTITFYNDVVCDKYEFLNSYPGVNGGDSRLDYFARQVMVMEHEIAHAEQFNEIDKQIVNGNTITPRSYIIQQQSLARYFATALNTKYYKKDAVDRLYWDNHDQFYYEIDADKQGIERMLEMTQTISPRMYEIAINEKRNSYLKTLNKKNNELANYDEIKWKHDTNPNNGEVSASHKASLIIDTILPKLGRGQRKGFFEKYPALNVLYNEDGSKKSLEQVEKEKQAKIHDILVNGSDDNIQSDANGIANLYDTAIEGDALLSLERSLQHIARLTWGSDRYFTDGGNEVKYSPKHIRKEMYDAKEKAMQIASTIEGVDAKNAKNLFAKYEKEAMNCKKSNDGSLRFYEDKKLALYNIQNAFYHNEEYKQTIKEQQEKQHQENLAKQQNKNHAQSVLKKVFPEFNPTSNIMDGEQLVPNKHEKMMLMEACRQYLKSVPSIKGEDFVPTVTIRNAINDFYDFDLTQEDVDKFNSMLKEEKVELPKNRYQIENAQEKSGNNEVFATNKYNNEIQK